MDETRVLWLLSRFKLVMRNLAVNLDAGMTPSVAYESAYGELDRHYRHLCSMETVPPTNHNLDPTSVESFARFALDAAIGAARGSCTEDECRTAFWVSFWRCTRPSLSAPERAKKLDTLKTMVPADNRPPRIA